MIWKLLDQMLFLNDERQLFLLKTTILT